MKMLASLAAIAAASSVLGHNVLAIGAASKEGETFTIGDFVFEIDTDGNIGANRHRVDLSAAPTPARAVQTLTTTGNAVADETVTIGAVVYTWKAVAASANQVKVGATASESLDNLVAAINAGAGLGTLYGSGTVVHPTVTATKASASTVTITAKTKGTGGNALVSTETMTNATFGAGTLAGGVDPTAAETIAASIAAINTAERAIGASPVTGGLIVVDYGGRGTVACSETMAGGGNAWQNAALVAPVSSGAIPNIALLVQRAATAAEVTAGSMFFPVSSPPKAVMVQVRTSAGVPKAWVGAVVIEGNTIIVDNTGGTDFAANDIVTVSYAV